MTSLKAIIFGSIGTITETSEMQRQSFNRAFAEAGHDWRWDTHVYREMISGANAVVGGGDRIAQFAASLGVKIGDDQVKILHAAKSRIFQMMMTDDCLPLNPGVEALIADAKTNALRVVFASTTSRANIDAMLAATRPAIARQFDLILSGEDVDAIKPAPDIYLAALERLALNASEVIAIEDSAPSMAAALAAGIATIIVPGKLWVGGSFEGASAVLPDLIEITVAKIGKLVADNALAA
jgi:HAD superfamily hydrolase (TIGR01509 family)